MRLEIISFSFKDWILIFNVHNAAPLPADIQTSNSTEYKMNFSEKFPRKNWNEFHIFAVKNDKETGTEAVEKLDKYEMYNNCEG